MSLNCSSHSEEYRDVTDEMDLLDLREQQDEQVLEETVDQEVSTIELRGWTERRVERLD